MKKEQVVNCQFSAWYPIFKKHTIKSLILPLPQNVIDYLLDDGTLVVSGSDQNSQTRHADNSDSEEQEDVQWSDDETTTTVTAPEFPEFTSKVLEAINSLGGRVFPKLNWSAPRVNSELRDGCSTPRAAGSRPLFSSQDANWIALNSSLQCGSLADIFLLFKSSDFITHDLTQPFLQCSDQDSPDPIIKYELVLRKWSELIPGGEFRCFVKENELIAISQRDYTQYYPHILKQEEQVSQAIQDFFSQNIQYHFLDEDFVFDVYRDSQVNTVKYTLENDSLSWFVKRCHIWQGKVWLIDLNPFGEVTDSLLFTWDELTSGGEVAQQQQEGPTFRFTTSEVTVQPSPCLSYRIPRDFVDLSTGEDAYKLIDFLKLTKNQQEDSEEEEEEEGDVPP
ncbi:Cell division cycle-like protein 123 [Oryzias melastigma]|uniref:Translation initiation factor eIF2 assembly protein n=1 Tax=Oryzias melastigma TaxID=30732 RepID=A0A834F0T6_ORYME|nr:Cell division cycle-like protein 123 [Oryzias melastigma]